MRLTEGKSLLLLLLLLLLLFSLHGFIGEEITALHPSFFPSQPPHTHCVPLAVVLQQQSQAQHSATYCIMALWL